MNPGTYERVHEAEVSEDYGARMANIKADEISKILREQIANYEQTVAVDEVGSIISVGDGIARIHGLDKVMAGEMLAFPHNVFGIALNLEEDEVGAVLLGETVELKEGDTVKRTNTIMSVPVGEALIGRVVSPRPVRCSGTFHQWLRRGLAASRILPRTCRNRCRVSRVAVHSA